MSTAINHLLNALTTSAFQVSLGGEILYMNEQMGKLFGAEADPDRERTIFGLGIFQNHAEFRGFLRGFKSVGPLQRIRLPNTRMKDASRQVVLNAVLHEADGERSVIGVLTISDPTGVVDPRGEGSTAPKVDDLPYFVFTTDGVGKITYANNTMRTFLELDREQDVTQFSLDGVDLDFNQHTWRNALHNTRKFGDYNYETNFRRPNGTVLPVCVQVVRVEGFPAKRVTVAAHDMSTVRKVEADVRGLILELEDLRRKRKRDDLHLRDRRAVPAEPRDLIVSSSPAYQPILRQIKQVAPTDSTVLITGETGTGKELVAKSIHQQSTRAAEPLVVVNCGALPKDLIESELFGYEKGAFTGAVRDRIGRFKLADEGTLFLDEVGEMPLDLQTRLLRFLQEGEFTPVGGAEPVYANVRIIAATNRELATMVREGTFRADLYFRLNVFPIHNIPLRDRKDDIPALVQHFIDKHGRRLNSGVTGCEPAVIDALTKYPFPGNIRELENIVERALILSSGDRLVLDRNITSALPDDLIFGSTKAVGADAGAMEGGNSNNGNGHAKMHGPEEVLSLDEMTRRYITEVLELTEGKVSGKGGAARLLDMNPQTLFSKIRKLGVDRS